MTDYYSPQMGSLVFTAVCPVRLRWKRVAIDSMRRVCQCDLVVRYMDDEQVINITATRSCRLRMREKIADMTRTSRVHRQRDTHCYDFPLHLVCLRKLGSSEIPPSGCPAVCIPISLFFCAIPSRAARCFYRRAGAMLDVGM